MLTPTMRTGLRYIKHIDESVTREQAELTLVRSFLLPRLYASHSYLYPGFYPRTYLCKVRHPPRWLLVRHFPHLLTIPLQNHTCLLISRRGAVTSSDIDIVLFHPSHVHVPTPASLNPKAVHGRYGTPFRATYPSASARASSPLLQDVVRPLEDRGLLAATLSSGPRKWQGVARLPERVGGRLWEERSLRLLQIQRTEGVYRRIDIKCVFGALLNLFTKKSLLNCSFAPVKSKGAALLALTGDVEFTRHVRGRALALGLHLNEFGLWRWQVNGNGLEHSDDAGEDDGGFWELVRAESEEEILNELGMEYVEPEKRNFRFVVGKDVHRSDHKTTKR